MSQYGANLQTNIMELVKYIEKFKKQRSRLDGALIDEEEERAKITNDIEALQVKLNAQDTKINGLMKQRENLDKILNEAETNLITLHDSSDAILDVLKRGTNVDI